MGNLSVSRRAKANADPKKHVSSGHPTVIPTVRNRARMVFVSSNGRNNINISPIGTVKRKYAGH